ncbi:MAG TPA: HNH endonuclease [Verrucomicrobiae bacterium]|jgi:hypothetical protein|nr:HNH endonuclease [Verrucomicrobiae bacterium]
MRSGLRNSSESEKGIRLSGLGCVICGWAKKDVDGNLLVEGAHVRKFGNVKDYDRFDNIVALCPNHHTEYDRGNLYIDFDKKVCYHMDHADKTHGQSLFGVIRHVQRGYFEYHRVHVFKGPKKHSPLNAPAS